MWFSIALTKVPNCRRCTEDEKIRVVVIKSLKRGRIPRWYVPNKQYRTRVVETLWYFRVPYHKNLGTVLDVLKPYIGRWLTEEEFKEAMRRLLTVYRFSEERWRRVLEFVSKPIEYVREPRRKRCVTITRAVNKISWLFRDAKVIDKKYYYSTIGTFTIPTLYREFRDSVAVLDYWNRLAIFVRTSCSEYEHLMKSEIEILRKYYNYSEAPKLREAIERVLSSVRELDTKNLDPELSQLTSTIAEYEQLRMTAINMGIIDELVDYTKVLGRLSRLYNDIATQIAMKKKIVTTNIRDLKEKLAMIADKLKTVIDELKQRIAMTMLLR
jgi:hypothetical protein